MNLSKSLLICSILTLIVVICKAEIIRESYSSRSSIAGNSLEEGSSGRVNPSAYNSGKNRAERPQRPNVAPIRPGYAARSSDSGRSQVPEATSWRDPQSSQPQRELIFVSRRNMRERLGHAGSNPKRRHSKKKHHHRNKSGKDQASRVQRPNEIPIRPAFTTEKPPAKFRHRNPEAFARSDLQSSSSQREQIFVSPPRQISRMPDTAEDKPRKHHFRKKHHHKNNSERDQASRVQRPNELPIRPAYTIERPAKFRHRNPEAFGRSPAAVIRIELE